MTPLTLWAERWGVPPAALDDLARITMPVPPPPDPTKRNEAYAQDLARLAEAQNGATLWRNNVGVLTNERGVPVRYGLANESKKMNLRIKSSDLIGWRPVVIGGVRIAQFVAREVKPQGWHYTGTGREPAQKAFLDLVNAAGGDARFTMGA